MIFKGVLLPIFIVISLGFILGKRRKIDTRSVSGISLYILTPSLILYSLVEKNQIKDSLKIVVFVFIFTFSLLMVSYSISRLMRLEREKRSAFLLSSLFINAGNYGLPFCLFTFGQEGLNTAIFFVVGETILLYSLAIFIASQKSGDMLSSLSQIFYMPLIYAVLFALFINYLSFELPEFLLKIVALLAGAAIPILLILLGIQLSKTKVKGDLKNVFLANFLRLFLSPLLAFLLLNFFEVSPLVRSVLIVEASMPTAVNSALISIEFDAKPEFVSTAVLTSTLLSIFSLSLVVHFLT
ncbi:MAG: AEC family transporter [Candidatus Methanofastidiosia archaeon]